MGFDMTCKEFLKILATNPDKRLKFVIARRPTNVDPQYANTYEDGGVYLFENTDDTVTLYLDGRE